MPTKDHIREILQSNRLLERLAEIEHERWASWQQYVHDQCQTQEDGSLIIPASLVRRWAVQIATPYSELSENEKRSDQEQVLRYLPAILEALTT